MNDSILTKLEWTEDDPQADSIGALRDCLADEDGRADLAGIWPEALWNLLKNAGAARWSLPEQ
jgi:hypothetical protein